MIRIAAALFAAVSFSGLSQAAEMQPMQAKSITLGGVTGIAYYAVVEDGFQVVATLSAGENGTPMRFVTTLVAGQRMLVSVPQAANQEPVELEFARLGDTVTVSEAPTVTAMTN